MSRASSRRARGMALFELLVTIAIFALLAAAAYGGLDTIARSKAAIVAQSDLLGAQQIAVSHLTRDLRQAIARGIRDGSGQTKAALMGDGKSIELTSGGFAPLPSAVGTSLRRIGYGLQENALVKIAYPLLDRADDNGFSRRVLLQRVRRLEFRYLHPQKGWMDHWPDRNDSARPDRLPKAVEFILTLENQAQIAQRVLLVQNVDDDAP